jgi:predicted RNase H-like HicB family nuclease
MKRYVAIIEKTADGYGAYIPDLPGCISAGDTYEEAEQLIREAVPFHFEGLRVTGSAIPDPATRAEFIDTELPVYRKCKSGLLRSQQARKTLSDSLAYCWIAISTRLLKTPPPISSVAET